MNDVASAAGVTKPVLYQHFSSKRELYRELLADVGDRLREEVAKAAVKAPSPRAQVEQGFTAFFGWVSRNRDGFVVLFAGDTRRDPEFAMQARKVEAEMADTVAGLIVVDGLPAERRRLLAYGIVGVAETTARHWLATGLDMEPEELADQVATLAWAGLRGLRPPEG